MIHCRLTENIFCCLPESSDFLKRYTGVLLSVFSQSREIRMETFVFILEIESLKKESSDVLSLFARYIFKCVSLPQTISRIEIELGRQQMLKCWFSHKKEAFKQNKQTNKKQNKTKSSKTTTNNNKKMVCKGRGRSLCTELLFLSVLQPRPFAGPCEFNSCI